MVSKRHYCQCMGKNEKQQSYESAIMRRIVTATTIPKCATSLPNLGASRTHATPFVTVQTPYCPTTRNCIYASLPSLPLLLLSAWRLLVSCIAQ
jgi:hypothetical protein